MLKIYHSLSDDSDEACTNILLGQQTATYAELMLQLKAKLQLNKADECKVFVQNQKTKGKFFSVIFFLFGFAGFF